MAMPFLEVRELTRRQRVSPELEKELAMRGVAQAVVYLDPAQLPPRKNVQADNPRRAEDFGDLDSCFVKDERSVAASLASASLAMTARAPRRNSRQRALAPPRYYSDIPRIRYFPALGILLGDIHHDGLERLAASPRVRYIGSSIAVNLIRPTAARTAALASDTTWGIGMMGIPRLWQEGLDGSGVRVAHLDTGVDANHPALSGAVAEFLFVDEHGVGDPTVAAFDTEEHGTHTAGTIAGRAVSGRAIGVAPGAMLYSAAVCDGGNLVARILAGMEWASRQGVRILNLSIGLRPYHDDFRMIMATLRASGVLPVCAVGNSGPGTSSSPGNYDLVLSVGGCDAHREVDRSSSSQWFARPDDPLVPDLVAPGVDVISARPGGGYQSLDGSSQAAPHLSGLAALLWQARPEATVAEIESAIFNSCNLGSMPQDRANRGLPNAPRAYEILTGHSLADHSTSDSESSALVN